MLAFFLLAVKSPPRQLAFRRMVVAHLCVVAGGAWLLLGEGSDAPKLLLGHLLLITGIVEGATLIGWRLTQLPKNQSLEFLLVSPLRPGRVFLAEALVGLARLALVTLAGLPVLLLLYVEGRLDLEDLGPLLVMPMTWGALAGLILTVWAFEPVRVRRWGGQIVLTLIILQLIVGVLAGEHLRRWLDSLPEELGQCLLIGLEGFQRYNPFAVMRFWLEDGPAAALRQVLGLELFALLTLGLLLTRGASRLHGHFQDRHYQVKRSKGKDKREEKTLSFSFSLLPFSFPDRPLAWWAVKRVSEYSGRINLWLAGGFGVLYALYIMAGTYWPSWLGRQVFVMCDQFGGVPTIATGLIILAAVPAAFQYGLWDSSAQNRCQRLELLLLTEFRGEDYWDAAMAAAWQRGRGYFSVAALLWFAGAAAGRLTLEQAAAALTTGALMWGMYFTLGFRAFSRGMQANSLGMLLTLVLPLLAYTLYQFGWPQVAGLLPVGSVYGAGTGEPAWMWLQGAVLSGAIALVIARRALHDCDRELRRWYELHHGNQVMT